VDRRQLLTAAQGGRSRTDGRACGFGPSHWCGELRRTKQRPMGSVRTPMVRAFSRRSERWPNRRDSEPSSSVLVVPRERLRLSSRWLEHPRSGSQTAISPRRPTLRIWLTPPHRVPARPSGGEKTSQSRSRPPRRQRDLIGIADIDSDREVMGSALDQTITDWAHP
jgi:hypothetical protein